MESLAKYVTDEYNNKLKEKVDTSDWTLRYICALASCMPVAHSSDHVAACAECFNPPAVCGERVLDMLSARVSTLCCVHSLGSLERCRR